MSYKTILVHADLAVHAPARLRFAARLANMHGAHLLGVATTGISRFLSVDSGLDIERSVVAGHLDRLREHARQALVQFEALARQCCAGTWEARLLADDPEGALVLMSRFADLVVMSQTDPANAVAGTVRDLPEYVVLNAVRPVLLLPFAGSFDKLEGKAVVAWNGSMEASRALGYALPLLRTASEVLVVSFDARPEDVLRDHGPDLCAWLARHGVTARVEQHAASDAGNALLSLAADQQAGLLVMGGYGHTRFRELVLGGVTRTVLGAMTAPVLMAH